MDTLVTIGLCIKNSEKTIKNCLLSILNQNYPKHLLEIIVVDGNSIDRSMSTVKRLLSNSGLASSFFCDEGKGIAIARQIVLENATSDYVIWVDGDVIIAENFVREQIDFMKKHDRVAVSIGKYNYQPQIRQTLVAKLQGLSKFLGVNEWANSKKRHGFPPNDASIYRVKASKQVGGFDTKIKGASEDEDIINRLRAQGWIVEMNEQAGFFAFSRETWSSFWLEQIWFGYGNHFLSHKSKNKNFFLRYSPFIYIYLGFRHGIKSYKLTNEKESFLLPLLYLFSTIALFFGFWKAHNEGYGHQ